MHFMKKFYRDNIGGHFGQYLRPPVLVILPLKGKFQLFVKSTSIFPALDGYTYQFYSNFIFIGECISKLAM